MIFGHPRAVTFETAERMRDVRVKHQRHSQIANGVFQMSHMLVLAFIAVLAFGVQPQPLAVFKRVRG
jgi:hypothetical protein